MFCLLKPFWCPCRESQDWTTTCSRMPERDGKASGLVLVRSPLLTSHKWREPVSPGRLVAFIEAAALRSTVLRYTGAPIVTRASFFFRFVYLEVSLFPKYFLYHCCFLFVWRVRCTSAFFWMVFSYLVTAGWIFDISSWENSIDQSLVIEQRKIISV